MKKWLLVLSVFCLLILGGTFILIQLFGSEPRLEGRLVSAWVNDLQRGTGEEKTRAAEVLKVHGASAAPYLAESIGRDPGYIQRLAMGIGPHIPELVKKPFRRLYDPGKQIMDKHAAAEALRAMGTNGQAAIPILGEMLKESNPLLSITASRALSAMGPEAVEPLIHALDNPDFNIRGAASDGLAHLGSVAAPAAPRLARILASEVGPITSSASYALSRIGEASVPVVVPLLQDTNAAVRRQAAFTLACAGWNAAAAAPALMELIGDPSPQVRAAVLDALGRVDPTSRRVNAAANTALDDPDPSVRGAALQLLRYRPRFVKENALRIGKFLDDEVPEVRAYAALALASAPEQAEAFRPRLEILAKDVNPVLQASAAEALKIIETTSR